MVLTKEFLEKLDTKIGDNLVIYDVAKRKVFFVHHNEEGFALRLILGKRKMPVKIRPKDKVFRVENGMVDKQNFEGFIVEPDKTQTA